MTKKQEKLLDRLNKLAYGDYRLVKEAMRKAGNPSAKSVKLKDVIEYIKKYRRHRDNWGPEIEGCTQIEPGLYRLDKSTSIFDKE